MADVTINYKGSKIAELNADGTKTLKTSGTYCEGDIAVNYVKPGSGIPSGGPKIKYIIPVTYKAKKASDGISLDAITFTFTRENVNQLFCTRLWLMDATDFTTPGYWVQVMEFNLHFQGNYEKYHNLMWIIGGAGKQGNLPATNKVANMEKTNLTQSFSFGALTASAANYARNGENYKGFIFITDSSYSGEPIVDASKFSQFFTFDGMTAGW